MASGDQLAGTAGTLDRPAGDRPDGAPVPAAEGAALRPLVIDLDGTLLKSDLLIESFFSLLRAHPLRAIRAVGALSSGKAALKARIADDSTLDLEALPLDAALLAYLRVQKAKGRALYLATAADRRLAEALAAHLGIFDGVFASDGVVNLSGANKAEVLCARFGQGGFDYIGNAAVDLPVWRRCAVPMAVNLPPGLLRRLREELPELQSLPGGWPGPADYLRVCRIHQWLKNILIFVPLVAGHSLAWQAWAMGLAAFVAYSLCASGVYTLNDLLDLPNDRKHPTKRFRPLASGTIPLVRGVALAPLLLVAALLVGLAISWRFVGLLMCYFVISQAYSLVLKRRLLVDVMVLSVLYTLRIFAGGVAAAVPISPWLMAFSVFLFLCLAIVKRYTELESSIRQGHEVSPGRAYVAKDAPMLGSLAAASGYGAVMVLALYINGPEVGELYRSPQYLWLVCLLLLYWVSRVLMIAHRGEMHEDPVLFAVKDRTSLGIGLAVLAIVAMSA